MVRRSSDVAHSARDLLMGTVAIVNDVSITIDQLQHLQVDGSFISISSIAVDVEVSLMSSCCFETSHTHQNISTPPIPSSH